MKPGPKKKPSMLSLIDGNPGKRPINQDEPKPAKVFTPRAPKNMTRVERAKWRQMVKVLGGMRVLTVADLDALEIYVRSWCSMQDARADLNERGKMIEGVNGGRVWNPSWTEYKHSLNVVRQIGSEFGLTPSTRVHVKADADENGASSWGNL